MSIKLGIPRAKSYDRIIYAESRSDVNVPYTGGLSLGDLVCYSESGISLSSALYGDKMPCVGIVTGIVGDAATITFQGKVTLNDNNLVIGKWCWVGTDSKITQVQPDLDVYSEVFLQKVGVALSNNSILFNPSDNIVIRRSW